MDIRNISIYSNGFGPGNGKQPPFLEIGRKGQVIEGTITKVAENVTIQFNGIEVMVARGTVKDAKEGQMRSFEVTDVSKEGIVLKEIGASCETAPVRGMVSTSVDVSDYSFAECLEAGRDVAQAEKKAGESLAVLNGEDYQAIENEEGSLMESTKECVERAAQKRKERTEWTQERLEEGAALRKEQQEGLEKIQAGGFLFQKNEAQVRQVLQQAGIPVTDDILSKVMTALGMSQSALELTDQSKAYIVGQELAPTIENLYQGKYQVSAGQMTAEEALQGFEGYREQIERILQACGRADEAGIQNAKWLFANELPVNESTLEKLEMLNEIPSKMTPDKILEQIVLAVTAGLSPRDAVLDDESFVIARNAIEGFKKIDDGTIIRVADLLLSEQNRDVQADENRTGDGDIVVNLELFRQAQKEAPGQRTVQETIPSVYTAGMTEEDILRVTMKRQLEEIRHKMTIQSAIAMEKKGIHIEIEPIDNIIHALREIENAYYSSQVAGEGKAVEPEHLELLQESLAKASDIARAHASILGGSVRQRALLTVNELHAAAGSQVARRNDWNGVYETVGTQVRADLGDSIQKAFEGIPAMLEDMGMERTQANERAVRILGYNGIEVTEENIEQIKVFDAKVNRVIDNMKPAVVLELIRRGENPLDMPLDELNFELEEIQGEKGISSEEKYSRFLWQMEKDGQITQDERKGYIGVYRLLNQLQKADGAAVGAVVETGQELTLGNLLTQVRTRRGKGIDSKVDDAAGVPESKGMKNSITEQINLGFSQGIAGQSQQTEYYRHMAEQALAELTPSKLQELTDGDMERLLNTSLEAFYEDLKQASGSQEIKQEFFEEQARLVREQAASSQAAEDYLSKLQVDNTISNILAAKAVLEEGYVPYKEAYARKKVLPEERQKEFDEAADAIADSIGDEEALAGQCEKAEKIMGEILTKSYEQADINLEELSRLRVLGRGIRLQGAFRHSRSYEIPIRTGDTITSLNLTLVHGAQESGRIQISMEHEVFGNISMDMKVTDGQIKGLVLCDRRQGFDALQEQKRSLEENLTDAGYQVKNISYGMDFKSRNELLNERPGDQTADTGRLYQAAKILVQSVTAVMQD